MGLKLFTCCIASAASNAAEETCILEEPEFIVTEMTLSGELDALFADKGVPFDRDAAEKIRSANA